MATAVDAREAYAGHRITAQRTFIAEAVVQMHGAFTVQELTGAVRTASGQRGTRGAGAATVYRAVASMEASGFLTRVGARDGHALYAHCAHLSHHHHVVCDGCGRVASAPCPLDSLDLTSPERDGFVITRHEVTLYGLCPECGDKKGRA